MDLLILSITPANQPKTGRKCGKGGKAKKGGKGKVCVCVYVSGVGVGLQERINGQEGKQTCSLLAASMDSPFHRCRVSFPRM